MSTEKDKELEQVIIAVKYSYLPKTSKKLLILLLKVKYPMQLGVISGESGYSKSHVASILNRLKKQKLIKKTQSIGYPQYTYTKECKKFLDIQQSLIFYKTKKEYSV